MADATAKRLYRVDWHGECFVMAESSVEAVSLALDEIMGAEDVGLDGSAVVHTGGAGRVPSDWAESIPFGGDDDRTVAEILKAEVAK
jgi:hypothetical protein